MPPTPTPEGGPHSIPTESRWNSSMALRISRSASCSRCSFSRRIEVRTSGMTPSVRIVITVIVMTSSMSVHPPDERGGKGKGEGGKGKGEGAKGEDLSASPLPFPLCPAVLIISTSRLSLRDLELAARGARDDAAPVGGDEVNLVGVEAE